MKMPWQERKEVDRFSDLKEWSYGTPHWPRTTAPIPGRDLGAYIIDSDVYEKRLVLGQWIWVVNEEKSKARRKQDYEHEAKQYADQQAKFALFYALRSRVLTDEEMEQVRQYGENINIPNRQLWSPEKKREELDAALLQQQNLRLIAAQIAAFERLVAKL